MMSVVSVICGPLGGGKTMYATKVLQEERRKGRRQYCTYQTPGARPLLALAHAWCPEFSGSDFTVDEAGSTYNARDTKDLDLLAFGAISHARHQDVRVRFIVQHPAMLDIQFRRLCERYIFVRRFGPSGEYARRNPSAPWWRRPWGFGAFAYRPGDLDPETMDVKAGKRPFKREWFRFSPTLAASYDSFNHVVPVNLLADFEALRRGAAACAALPEFVFLNGRPQAIKLPTQDVIWPVSAASAASRFRHAEEAAARSARISFLRSIGYFSVEDAPDSAILPWPKPDRVDRYVPFSGRITVARPVDGQEDVVEILVDEDQWIVMPAVVAGTIDLGSLAGGTLSCTLAAFKDGDGAEYTAISLDHPVRVVPFAA